MPADILVRTARKSRRFSQEELSRRSGIANSSLSQIEHGHRNPTVATLERLLAATGQRLISIPTRRADAATIGSEIRIALLAGQPDVALRQFIQLNDNLHGEHNEVRFALAIAEPPLTGAKHWDAAIAALVEYHLEEENLPFPTWTQDPQRSLSKTWTFNAGRYVVPVDPSRVPKPFLDRKVLVDRETLVSV